MLWELFLLSTNTINIHTPWNLSFLCYFPARIKSSNDRRPKKSKPLISLLWCLFYKMIQLHDILMLTTNHHLMTCLRFWAIREKRLKPYWPMERFLTLHLPWEQTVSYFMLISDKILQSISLPICSNLSSLFPNQKQLCSEHVSSEFYAKT